MCIPCRHDLDPGCNGRPPTKLLLTYAEVGELLGVSKDTVRNIVRNGQLYSVVVGKSSRRITRAELDRYVTNLDRAAYGLPPVTPPVEVQAARDVAQA